MWPYLITMVAMLAGAWVARRPAIVMTLGILLADWAINSAAVYVTGNGQIWPVFLSVDYIAALLLVIHGEKPTRAQLTIAVLFAFECLLHGWYGISKQNAWDKYHYYYALSYTAWAQLGIVGAWGAFDLIRQSGVIPSHMRVGGEP